MPYQLDQTEQKLLAGIEKSLYMRPLLTRVDAQAARQRNSKKAWAELFDHIYSILLDAKKDVDKILAKRKANNEIKDISQARKSIAGNAFSNIVVYLFLHNKIVGNIKPDIFITNKKSQVKNFDDIATIYVSDETQKPDCDLIIFSRKSDGDIRKCIILSLKTSLRERAGQTYKWKLLMEIATTPNAVREKYNITYRARQMPLVCFATVNFYDEINNPQHRGMFKFFDKSFIAKPVNKGFIASLSQLIRYANTKL